MHKATGFSSTKDSYLVGEDKFMRSDSIQDSLGHSVIASFKGVIEKNGVNTEAVNSRLMGSSDTKIIKNYLGERVLASWCPIQVGDMKWVLTVELSEKKVLAPINKLMFYIFLIAIAILSCTFILAYTFSKNISTPIAKLIDFTKEISEGKGGEGLNKWLHIKSYDEIGLLINVFNTMVETLKDTTIQANKIAWGDFISEITPKSEKDELWLAFSNMMKMLQKFNEENEINSWLKSGGQYGWQRNRIFNNITDKT